MRLFMFKSEGNRGLLAFVADPGGAHLPSRHGPWTAVGVVREDKDPPCQLSREIIEKSIADQGFQLYKMKKTADS
jgi:invasion protein IalB